MGLLDVSMVLRSPKFNQSFSVYRNGAGKFGLGGWIEGTLTEISMRGIVHPSTSEEIEQMPEADRVNEAMTFYSLSALYVAKGDNPSSSDKVVFQGDTYKLVSVKNYSQYGYYKAIGARIKGD